MATHLTESVIQNLQFTGKPRDVRDDKVTGFMVRVNSDGSKTYYVEYAHGKRMKIGRFGDANLPVSIARLKAQEIIVKAKNGQLETKHQVSSNMTYQQFVEDVYREWLQVNKKSGVAFYEMIRAVLYPTFGHVKMSAISAGLVEKFKTDRQKKKKKPSTINKNLGVLKTSLSYAAEWGYIEYNPIQKIRLLKEDRDPMPRYLKPEEEERFYKILPQMPDYMQTIIILAMNTAARKGELLSLTWDRVILDDEMPHIVVLAEYSKTGQTRTVPLNQKAQTALKIWKEKSQCESYVFVNPQTKKPYEDVRKYWDKLRKLADIKKFRFHDQRHHCASKLVMKGVDLYTTKEVLGHADIKMTQRYAKLAPKAAFDAVAKLD